MPFRTTVTRGGMVLLPISDSSKVKQLDLVRVHIGVSCCGIGKMVIISIISTPCTNTTSTMLKQSGKINSFFNFSSNFTLLNVKTPKQANNVDSGVHMLMNVDAVIWNAIENLSFSLKSVQEILLPLSKPNIQA